MVESLSYATQALTVVWNFVISNWYFATMLVGVPLFFAGLYILNRIVRN